MGEKEIEGDDEIETRRALFKQYIEPNIGLIYKICLQYTGNSNDVEDNYQECLINFFKYIQSYNPNLNILTWIHIVSKRHTISLEEKRGRQKFDFIEPEAIQNTFIASEDDGMMEITMDNYRDNLSDEMLDAIDSLNPIYRDTLLKKMCGYKLKEIMQEAHKDGTLKNKNLETIKSRLYLARQQLQIQLEDYYAKRRD